MLKVCINSRNWFSNGDSEFINVAIKVFVQAAILYDLNERRWTAGLTAGARADWYSLLAAIGQSTTMQPDLTELPQTPSWSAGGFVDKAFVVFFYSKKSQGKKAICRDMPWN